MHFLLAASQRTAKTLLKDLGNSETNTSQPRPQPGPAAHNTTHPFKRSGKGEGRGIEGRKSVGGKEWQGTGEEGRGEGGGRTRRAASHTSECGLNTSQLTFMGYLARQNEAPAVCGPAKPRRAKPGRRTRGKGQGTGWARGEGAGVKAVGDFRFLYSRQDFKHFLPLPAMKGLIHASPGERNTT